jgi:protein-export membrane protein SecD
MMPTAWKWKVILLLGVVILSSYLLVPTFFGFSKVMEKAEMDEAPLPWYFSVFPEKGINLGLDLRGGIYMEFEVETGKAIANKVDTITDDLERAFKKDNIKFVSMRQEISNNTIEIKGLNAESRTNAMTIVNSEFSTVLSKSGTAPETSGTMVLALQKKYKGYLHDRIIKQALEKVRNRIDRYGVAEPSIQRLGSDRIAVELPGIKDPQRAIGIIKKAGQLEFKIVNDTIVEAKLVGMISKIRKDNNLPDNYSTKTLSRINELLAPQLPQDTEVAFELRYDPVTKGVAGAKPYLLNRKAMVTGAMLKNAQVDIHNNEPYVSLTFDTRGKALFGEVTTKNVGKRMAILLDGTVTKAPVIREPILGGRAQITLGYGNYADLLKEAEDLILVLQEGALPAQLTEAMKTIVGPSLGADSIHKGIVATVIGAIIVCLFMLIYYKGSGLIADIALIVNLLLILSALALFQATLTLPGIAGIVLTLGMAVDANVLIFERIREELRLGKNARAAIESGYHNAMRTIIDANITTLIVGVVLYQFGTGPIKGFAVTLIIGLSVSMYTACVCTRMVYDYFLIKRKMTKISI